MKAPVSASAGKTRGTDSRAAASGSRAAITDERWKVAGVCVFLATIIWVVFGQALHHGFVNFDDDKYVYGNAEVVRGLTAAGVVWAFTSVYAFNWHPLTWISHMLDCQFYGLHPGGHHFTSILLHTVVAILLFLVLRGMTGFLWRSAFVAAVFAIHPLRVESVAWVAERKDVLSGVFFMLTIGAYAGYARKPWSPMRYGVVMLLFALGLMSKPMLVTLPFVLLLLDYWPLNRLQGDDAAQSVFRLGGMQIPRRVILEKLPLLGLVAASCAATIFAQSEAIRPLDQISLSARLGNAVISYAAYLEQMFWPTGLSVLYPFPANGAPAGEVILASMLLLSVSTGVFLLRKSRPYLLVGWLWYLVMLAPVIGILQVGTQARADRYTYLPQIGLYLMLAWLAADLCAGRRGRVVLVGCAAGILAALAFCARAQTAYWQNSETLWTRALACTSDNSIAECNLGYALFQRGKVDEAIDHYQTALRINPNDDFTCNNLGLALFQKGEVTNAVAQYQKALEINPVYMEAQNNLGNALCSEGKVDEAIAHYQKALQINSEFAEAHYNLGNALSQKGDVEDAVPHYEKAVQINPDFLEAQFNLGSALLQKGNAEEAITHFREALRLRPDYAEAQNSLAWVLAICPDASLRNGRQAVELAQRANLLTGNGNPVFLGTLAAAYAEAGRFPEAVQTGQRALQLAEAQSNSALAGELREQMKLYQAGRPYHLN
jgi:tetratricopeptide (TPR) repeat protein